MIVKELKDLLSGFSDYSEVMINNEGLMFHISRNMNRVNLNKDDKIIAEELLDDKFDEKESVVMLSTY